MRYDIQTRNVTKGAAFVRLLVYRDKERLGVFDTGFKLQSNHDWQTQSHAFQAPNEATHIVLELHYDRVIGEVAFDNIHFQTLPSEQLSDSEGQAQTPNEASPQIAPSEEMPSLIRNGSFSTTLEQSGEWTGPTAEGWELWIDQAFQCPRLCDMPALRSHMPSCHFGSLANKAHVAHAHWLHCPLASAPGTTRQLQINCTLIARPTDIAICACFFLSCRTRFLQGTFCSSAVRAPFSSSFSSTMLHIPDLACCRHHLVGTQRNTARPPDQMPVQMLVSLLCLAWRTCFPGRLFRNAAPPHPCFRHYLGMMILVV